MVPRPENGRLTLRVGTGGSPGSSVNAGRRGLPVVYGILGGDPVGFAPLADLYRQTAIQAGTPAGHVVGSLGGADGDHLRAARGPHDEPGHVNGRRPPTQDGRPHRPPSFYRRTFTRRPRAPC